MALSKHSICFKNYDCIEIVEGTTRHSFPMHIHDSECYITITDGFVDFYHNGKTVLQKDDTVIVPRGAPHTLAAIDNMPYSYRTLCIKYADRFISADDFLHEAYSYILSKADKHFDVEELAGYMGYSKYHVIHKFKERSGISPYQFYLNARVKKIRQGLHLNQSLPELSYKLCFSHQSHMCNVFKQYMGVTPTEYQRAYHLYANAGEKVASI